MRFVSKVFFFSLLTLLLSSLPVSGGRPDRGPALKKIRKAQRNLMEKRWIGLRPQHGDRHSLVVNVDEALKFSRGELTQGMEVQPRGLASTSMNLAEKRAVQSIVDDFLVNDDTTGGTDQYYPAIARDSAGNFVIAWQDYRNGYPDIYAQRYNSSGTPLDSSFKANDYTGTISGDQGPAIAMDGSGNFVVSWIDYRDGNYDIYAQRYDFSGTPSGSNFRVNDDGGVAAQDFPAIAMNDSGKFVITWEDWRNDNPLDTADIYAQRYDASGTALGSNFKVNDGTGFADSWSPPRVAMDSSANFVIVWEDDRNGNADVYAQRYNSSGVAMGSNFKVNDDAGTDDQGFPAIAVDGSGNFAITWEDYRNGDADVYAQRYNSSGSTLSSNFKVNDDAGTADQGYSGIAMDASGNFVVAWEDGRNDNYDIYAQRYNSSGSTLGSNFKVNDDVGTADQYSPGIAGNGSGNFIITWHDYRNGNYDVYAQRYNSSGVAMGSNFKVNDDAGTAEQGFPAIAVDSSGDFIITWEDGRNGNWDIYAQRYNSSGSALSSNFKVNGDAGTAYQGYPAVAMDGTGSFVITWEDYRNDNYDIYAQRYSSSGTPLGSNSKINDDVGTTDQWDPDIAVNVSGGFVITWNDERNSSLDVYAQRYNSSGSTLGSNFKVNDDVGMTWHLYPAIALDSSGSFVITWNDERNSSLDVYAQRYNSSGSTLGPNFKVNDDVGATWHLYPDVAVNSSGSFVVTWDDARDGNWDIYAQRYTASGSASGVNYLVSNTQYAEFAQVYPVVAANSNNIYFTWMDNRRAKGWDIYAKIVDWDWTKVEDENEGNLPSSFELCQNYPNPFNPTTTIPFTVHGSQFAVHSLIHTTLKIYNIKGQLVRTLVDEEKSPGDYTITWDGKDQKGNQVSSGVYFYRVKSGEFEQSKRMVLVK